MGAQDWDVWVVSSAVVLVLLGDLVKSVPNFVPWFPYLCSFNSFSCPAVPVWGWNTLSCCCPGSSVLLGPWPPLLLAFSVPSSCWWENQIGFFLFLRQMMLDVSQFANWLDNSHYLFLVKVWICNLGANIHRQTPIKISKLNLYFQTVTEAFSICFQLPTHLLTPVH